MLIGEIGELPWDQSKQILKAMEELPDDPGVEDALDRLYLLYKVERGLLQANRGELISQEQVRQRMAKWIESGPPPDGAPRRQSHV